MTKYKARNLSQIGTILKLTSRPFYFPIHKGMQANIFLPQGIISLLLCVELPELPNKSKGYRVKFEVENKILVCVCPVIYI